MAQRPKVTWAQWPNGPVFQGLKGPWAQGPKWTKVPMARGSKGPMAQGPSDTRAQGLMGP